MKLTKRGENVVTTLSVAVIVILGSAIDSFTIGQLAVIASFTTFVSAWYLISEHNKKRQSDTPIGDKLAKEMHIKLNDKNRAA